MPIIPALPTEGEKSKGILSCKVTALLWLSLCDKNTEQMRNNLKRKDFTSAYGPSSREARVGVHHRNLEQRLKEQKFPLWRNPADWLASPGLLCHLKQPSP